MVSVLAGGDDTEPECEEVRSALLRLKRVVRKLLRLTLKRKQGDDASDADYPGDDGGSSGSSDSGSDGESEEAAPVR